MFGINIYPSNIIVKICILERYRLHNQAVLAATCINRLTYSYPRLGNLRCRD